MLKITSCTPSGETRDEVGKRGLGLNDSATVGVCCDGVAGNGSPTADILPEIGEPTQLLGVSSKSGSFHCKPSFGESDPVEHVLAMVLLVSGAVPVLPPIPPLDKFSALRNRSMLVASGDVTSSMGSAGGNPHVARRGFKELVDSVFKLGIPRALA